MKVDKAYKKQVANTNNTKFVFISRTKLSDGYNYYLTLLQRDYLGRFYINESYVQKNSILSEKEALATAKKVVSR